jgi:hypothetical protein
MIPAVSKGVRGLLLAVALVAMAGCAVPRPQAPGTVR